VKDFAHHGWKEVSLGEICEKTETVDPRKAPEDEFEYVDVSSVSNETFTIGETQKLLGADAPSRARRQIRSGDILFATIRPTLQRIAQVPEHFDRQVCSTGYIVLRPKPALDARFLMYALFRPDFMDAMENLQSGASYPAVTDKQVRDQRIPLPPLEEQQRIVAVLDEAFEGLARARAHAEANLQNARELFERQLGEYFSEMPKHWVSRKLKQITSKIGSGATPKGGAGAYKTEGISLIRSLNVHDRWFKEEKLAFIDDEQADKLSNVVIEERDVLLNITGASIARCGVVPSEFLPARVNQHVSIIRPDHAVLSPEFLALMLTSQPYKDGLLKTGEDNGSTRQALTKALIESLEVSFPPDVAEQEAVVLDLEAAEMKSKDLAEAYRAKIQDLDDLRQSLLQKAFAGELT